MTTLDPRISKFEALLHDWVDRGTLPGAGLIFSSGEEVATIYAGSHGGSQQNVNVTADSVFALHSVSKLVTSICAQRLVERGLLDWLAPVSMLLEGWQDPPGAKTLVWHLASHTSGMTYGGSTTPQAHAYRRRGFEKAAPPNLRGAALYRAASHLPRLFEPGAAWGYSLSSDVLGWILEEVMGLPLVEIVNQEFCTPLLLPKLSTTSSPSAWTDITPILVRSGDQTFSESLDSMRDWGIASAPSSGGGGLAGAAAHVAGLARAVSCRSSYLVSQHGWRLLLSNHIPNGRDLRSAVGVQIRGRHVDKVGFGFGAALVPSTVTAPAREAEWHVSEVGWEGAAGCLYIANPLKSESLAFVSNVLPIRDTGVWQPLRSIFFGHT